MTAVSSAIGAGSQLGSQISMAVAGKTLDAAKAQGQAAVSLLEDAAQMQQQLNSSGNPHVGRLLDVVG